MANKQQTPQGVQSTAQSISPPTSSTGPVSNMSMQEDLDLQCSPEEADPAVAAARAEIASFYSQCYSEQSWVTANGYGAFDLCYEPNTGTCAVSVDIEFDFQNAPASVMLKYLGAMDLPNLAECVWSDADKTTFQDDMFSQVDRVWSGQHQLGCTYRNPDLTDGLSPTWEQTRADVSFAVNPVRSGGHFKIAVVALPAADNLRSFVTGTDHDSKAGVDANGDGTPDRAAVGSTTSGRSVPDSEFLQGGGSFNKHDNTMEDKSSSFDGNTYVVKKGDTLSGIAQALYGDMSMWRRLYAANKGVVGADPDLIIPGQNLVLDVPDTEQVTSAHEFGHMLGLDDQYIGGGGGSGTAGSVNDDGSNTSAIPADEHRIMDGGEVVLQEHYTTVVNAMNAATAPVTFGV
ncbi:MAG: LysM repeat protein [Myxococcota bacterium]|jgi:LysM repeat protein